MGRKTTRLEELVMGFDLHGEGPFVNVPEIDWENNPSFEEKEVYFAAKQKYERDNPGYYFRNNVWYWRPLWQLVVNMCEDILTIQDAEAGTYNDFYLINKTKAKRIAKRLQKALDVGDIDTWKKERQEYLDSLEMVPCDICNATGYRKMNDSNVPTICNACKGKKEKPDFATGYPFSVKNVKEFIEFCKNSGGFKIG